MMAVSPAIPIMNLPSYDDYDRRERLALSFKEDALKLSPLEEMMHNASLQGAGGYGSDDEDGDGPDTVSEGDDAG